MHNTLFHHEEASDPHILLTFLLTNFCPQRGTSHYFKVQERPKSLTKRYHQLLWTTISYHTLVSFNLSANP